MKDEEKNTKEIWQKPEICDLDIKKTATKYDAGAEYMDVFGS